MSPELLSFLLFLPFLIIAVITGIFFFRNGYKNGLWHALISLGMTILSAVISILLANAISGAVAPTLYSLIPAELLEQAGVFEGLISSLTQGLIRSVMALILFSLLLFVMLIITKLVASSIQNGRLNTQEKPLKYGGMGVRAIDTVIVTLLMLLPLYGILASYISPVTSIAEASGQLGEGEAQILSVIKNHPLVSVYKNGPTAWVNDSLGGIELEGARIDPAKIARTAEEVMDRVEDIINAEGERQLELVNDFSHFLNDKVIKESWCYDLIMGVKGELEVYVDQLSPEEQVIAEEILDILDMNREDFVKNGEAVLELVSYTLEKEVLPHLNSEEEITEPSDEFFLRLGKTLNVSSQSKKIKRLIVTYSLEAFFESNDIDRDARSTVEAYYKDTSLSDDDLIKEAKSIILMTSADEEALEGYILNPFIPDELCTALGEKMFLKDIENEAEDLSNVKAFIQKNPEVRAQLSGLINDYQSGSQRAFTFGESYRSFKNYVFMLTKDGYNFNLYLSGPAEQNEKLINELAIPVLSRAPDSDLEFAIELIKLFNSVKADEDSFYLERIYQLALAVKKNGVPQGLSSEAINKLEKGETETELEEALKNAFYSLELKDILETLIKEYDNDPLKLGEKLSAPQRSNLKLMIEAVCTYYCTRTSYYQSYVILPEGADKDISTVIIGGIGAGKDSIANGNTISVITKQPLGSDSDKEYVFQFEKTPPEKDSDFSSDIFISLSPDSYAEILTDPENSKENYEAFSNLLIDFFGL